MYLRARFVLCVQHRTNKTILIQVQKCPCPFGKTGLFFHVYIHFQYSHQEILRLDSAAGRGADEARLSDRERV